MGKNVVIHIGAHKTGTTSIQQFFYENREPIRALGTLYPESCHYHFAQHRLAFALRQMRDPARHDTPDFAAESLGLAEEIERSPCRQVFLSSEEFFSLQPEKIAAIREALKDHDVRILAVLRRPDELFASLYNQMVKEPRNRFMRRHATFLDEPSSLSRDLCFDTVLNNWSEVFGREAIVARCFEEYPDAVTIAAESVGLDPHKLPEPPPRTNVSVSIRTAEMIRMAKHAGFTEAQLRKLYSVGGRVFGAAGREDSLLSPDERLHILRKSDAMTDHVFATYVGRPNIYASRNFKAADFVPRTLLGHMDLIRVMSRLIPKGQGQDGA